jgi:hypothetical protein
LKDVLHLCSTAARPLRTATSTDKRYHEDARPIRTATSTDKRCHEDARPLRTATSTDKRCHEDASIHFWFLIFTSTKNILK